MVAHIVGRQCASPGLIGDGQPAARLGVDDDPGLPVRDIDPGVVAASGDPVPHTDPFAPAGHHGVGSATGDLAGDGADLLGQAVDPGGLFAGVGDDESPAGGVHREDLLPLDLAGVDHDLAPAHQLVEECAGVLALAHPQRQGRVSGVGEPADTLELDMTLGGVPGGEVEHSPTPDRGELMPVPHQDQRSAGGVGELEQGAGGVLVQHPGLVDHQQGPPAQPGCGRRGFGAGPAAVLVPSVAVLVQQPARPTEPGCRSGGRRPGLPCGSGSPQASARLAVRPVRGWRQGGLSSRTRLRLPPRSACRRRRGS